MDEKLLKKEILRDIKNKLDEAKHDGFIIPELVFEVIREVELEHGLLD